MTTALAYKNILLGVTGSIAAYKSADLVRRLRECNATVRVVMTDNAKQFITPLTMQAVSGFPVHDDLFDLQAEAAMGHIELARWADVVLIAPATADCIARLNMGRADDLLTTICLATSAPIFLAPAMNQAMWRHQLTQANLNQLQDRSIAILGTGTGSQACGDIGPGRMLEPLEIIKEVSMQLPLGLLAGVKLLVTAGPTREAIDPVRFIMNGSSGKMGYALAIAARAAGAEVLLISGPTALPPPPGVQFQAVTTAIEMQTAVLAAINDYQIFLSVAAVSDYRPAESAVQKIAKKNERFLLELIPNPDIIASVNELPQRPYIVGFAAETHDVIERARAKRARKNMDLIIANLVGDGIGMHSDNNSVTLISELETVALPSMAKTKLAIEIMQYIAADYLNKIN